MVSFAGNTSGTTPASVGDVCVHYVNVLQAMRLDVGHYVHAHDAISEVLKLAAIT